MKTKLQLLPEIQYHIWDVIENCEATDFFLWHAALDAWDDVEAIKTQR